MKNFVPGPQFLEVVIVHGHDEAVEKVAQLSPGDDAVALAVYLSEGLRAETKARTSNICCWCKTSTAYRFIFTCRKTGTQR